MDKENAASSQRDESVRLQRDKDRHGEQQRVRNQSSTNARAKGNASATETSRASSRPSPNIGIVALLRNQTTAIMSAMRPIELLPTSQIDKYAGLNKTTKTANCPSNASIQECLSIQATSVTGPTVVVHQLVPEELAKEQRDAIVASEGSTSNNCKECCSIVWIIIFSILGVACLGVGLDSLLSNDFFPLFWWLIIVGAVLFILACIIGCCLCRKERGSS